MARRFKLLLALGLLAGASSACAQQFVSSNLPLVLIRTDSGRDIHGNDRYGASMKIVWHPDGTRNALSDTALSSCLNYSGRISIKLRGHSSREFSDKRPYSVKTCTDNDADDRNVSLLAMPAGHDWVLNSLAYDQTAIRDALSFSLSQDLGNYAPRWMFCELFFNGEYRGLYLFSEKIARDAHRVNVPALSASNDRLPSLSGGYIVKADKVDADDSVVWYMDEYQSNSEGRVEQTAFQLVYPKLEDITLSQREYIHRQFLALEAAAHLHDTSLLTGIPALIDVPSFVDFMLVAEYASNVDVYSFSTFYHKDRGGKLRAGPLWDYNLAYGFDLAIWGDRSRYDCWQFSDNGTRFFRDLFNTSRFRCLLARRWHEVSAPGGPLAYDRVCALVDSLDAVVAEAVARDNIRWHQMEQHVMYVDSMKTWLAQRMQWISDNIDPAGACPDPQLPPLVISRIHYNPLTAWYIPSSLYEFVEITNAGTTPVDLTGFGFSALGFCYQFSPGTVVAPGQAVSICADTIVCRLHFQQLATPVGQFARHLSDSGQRLLLTDPWGNVVDEVVYSDSAPWPTEANGQGAWLKLSDLSLDNSLPFSWVAEFPNVAVDAPDAVACSLWPNPCSDFLHVAVPQPVRRIRLFSSLGLTVLESTPADTQCTLRLANLPNGVYVVELQLADGSRIHRKVLKR